MLLDSCSKELKIVKMFLDFRRNGTHVNFLDQMRLDSTVCEYGKMPNGLTPKSERRCVSLISAHSAHRKWEGLGTNA